MPHRPDRKDGDDHSRSAKAVTEKQPVKRRSRTGLWILLVILFCVIVAAVLWGGYTWHRLNHAPLPARAAGTVFTLERGESLAHISRTLTRRGVLEHAWDLRALARVRGVAGNLQAGEYQVKAGMSVAGLSHMMVAGKVLMHGFTVIPGRSFKEVFARLESNPAFRHTLQGLGPAEVMARLGHAGEKAEGRFFPQTYDFPRGTSDLKVLQRAYQAMHQHLREAWKKRAPDLVIDSPYQALIIASIIEKETAVPSERPRIAGVFERRLKKGMALGADPTVIYGLGDKYHGKLTRKDMTLATPYNTYLHRGLPPTPICMPSLASIKAALHPAHGTALYFVARGDGTHVFSDTLAEQQRMIRKYQLHKGDSSGHD